MYNGPVFVIDKHSGPNDDEALRIMSELYPNRSVVGIDLRELYVDG